MTDASTETAAPAQATETNAERLEQAVEAAGYVHPDAPAGYPTPGHKMAAEQTPEEVDHLKAIADLANEARTSSPAGVEAIADQIMAHVQALQAGQ